MRPSRDSVQRAGHIEPSPPEPQGRGVLEASAVSRSVSVFTVPLTVAVTVVFLSSSSALLRSSLACLTAISKSRISCFFPRSSGRALPACTCRRPGRSVRPMGRPARCRAFRCCPPALRPRQRRSRRRSDAVHGPALAQRQIFVILPVHLGSARANGPFGSSNISSGASVADASGWGKRFRCQAAEPSHAVILGAALASGSGVSQLASAWPLARCRGRLRGICRLRISRAIRRFGRGRGRRLWIECERGRCARLGRGGGGRRQRTESEQPHQKFLCEHAVLRAQGKTVRVFGCARALERLRMFVDFGIERCLRFRRGGRRRLRLRVRHRRLT